MSMLRVLFALLSAMLVTSSHAQQPYPNKSIQVIVPYAAGGAADVSARMIAQRLSEKFGVPVVVQNRPGAGGVIGSDVVAKADPDGYTLLVTSLSHTINPSLKKDLPFDTLRDFAAVATISDAPNFLVVHPSVQANSVAELVGLARAQQGKLAYASSGTGTGTHLAGELFKSLTKTNMLHVPYRGGAPAITDLLAGQVQLSFATMTTALEHVRQGRLRGLGVTGSKRFSGAPDVPTIAEAVPGYQLSSWTGLFAPAATPRPVIDRLASEMATILKDPTLKESLMKQGAEPAVMMPDEFSKFITSEVAKWKKVVEASGMLANK